MELDFDKFCIVDGSPTTVLPSPRNHPKIEKRKSKRRSRVGKELLSINEDFTEINFHRYRSASCKNSSSRRAEFENSELLRRGSVYQSSKDVRQIKKIDATEGRRKIELSGSSAEAFSFGIVDSLCSLDEDSSLAETNRSSSLMSLNSESSTAAVPRTHVDLNSQDMLNLSPAAVPGRDEPAAGFFKSERGKPSPGSSKLSFDLRNRTDQCAANGDSRATKITSPSVISPVNDGNSLPERVTATNLHKSLSAKLALPHSPARSESDCSRPSSPKARFSPIRKMFDPFIKSKSQRSPLSSVNELDGSIVGISRSKTSRKSLLHDFSNSAEHLECKSLIAKKVNRTSLTELSPAHLHGTLKSDNKHGLPSFEFSLKSPEDVLVAKTWKVANTSNWVYTFHSLPSKRTSASGTGWGLKDSNRESTVVAQMQVSNYLCADLQEGGAFDDSIVTEFVLYDISRPRKSVSTQKNSNSVSDVGKAARVHDEDMARDNSELNEILAKAKIKGQISNARDSAHLNSSTSHPFEAAELPSDLEVAAIVIQVPCEKRESLKFKSGDKNMDQPLRNPDLSGVEQAKEACCISPAKVNVVIPSGNHSIPCTESRGPSPLLDRWRLGGGCDCGGWDMSCPLNVISNPNVQTSEEHHYLMGNRHPLELFIQGRKDDLPALSMTIIEDGQYAVDFHAQLSTIQAFSICVALLHSVETSNAVGHERNKQLLQCDSLRVFIEEEVKHLIDRVTDEEKHSVNKKMDEVLPSFIVHPPFSPIARV